MAAPGEDMVHACGRRDRPVQVHGTSDATALASASAALIWSKHPTWTNNQVLRVMLNTIGAPTDGAERNDSIGYGIVRPRIALQNPGDPGPADEYPLPDLAAAASASPTPEPSATDGTDSPAQEKNTETEKGSLRVQGRHHHVARAGRHRRRTHRRGDHSLRNRPQTPCSGSRTEPGNHVPLGSTSVPCTALSAFAVLTSQRPGPQRPP